MTEPAPHPDIPTRADREAHNAALLATGTETGFWDDNGRPAPWPEIVDAHVIPLAWAHVMGLASGVVGDALGAGLDP